MADEHIEDMQPHDRRRFFRAGVLRALRPVSDYVERRLPPPRIRTVIRPPGARPEDSFLELCNRCGNCADACPAKAIQRYQASDPDMSGTPYIDPDLAPCILCEAQACMKACTSGALQVIPRERFHMGYARIVNVTSCLLWQSQPCGICIEKCPMGDKAIRLSTPQLVEIVTAGCVGCGVCQHHCPGVPKTILVTAHP